MLLESFTIVAMCFSGVFSIEVAKHSKVYHQIMICAMFNHVDPQVLLLKLLIFLFFEITVLYIC